MENQVIIHDAREKQWLHFRNVRHVITANTIDDVVSALNTVERMVYEQGFFAAGFISYEASPAFDPSFRVRSSSSFPLLWFGLYAAPDIIKLPDVPLFSAEIPINWNPSIDRRTYNEAISRIKDYIARGETYQVNYTYRLHAPFFADPWHLFRRIIQAQQAEYGAYLDTGRFAVCSASPELFFHLNGSGLTTRPMKGTASRGLTLSEDKARADWLYNSEKNRAENIMIVDMIRNDLGRIAETGSVKVLRLFDIERYPTVWQMTSTVTAESSASVCEILSALFPCASITGAPKSNTTRIIAGLETTPRNIYTGCIGFITPERKAQFNVAIRTVLVDRELKLAEYGVGGGIVWDSSSTEEYEECQTKSQVLMKKTTGFSLLETLLYTQEEKYFLLDYHLRRLRDSAEYFGIPVSMEHVLKKLENREESFPAFPQKVRVLVSQEGDISCEYSPLDNTAPARPVRLGLASKAVDSKNPYVYHKTTNREVYESAVTDSADCDDILLWNEHGEITETTIANVVFRLHGELVTPPVTCGLLPGTYRAWLLDRNIIKEKIITLNDLKRCDSVHVINSVRKKREAILIGYENLSRAPEIIEIPRLTLP
ncbi:MAG: aminodeoxychorismate synthase component I [Candidatus Latescibacter sp.]|nr:aminodeoxychorismate synthase component I [Candidatus Latescibacter sp.]